MSSRYVTIMTLPIASPVSKKDRAKAMFTYDVKEYFRIYPRNVKTYTQFVWSLCNLEMYDRALDAFADMKVSPSLFSILSCL